MLLERVVSHACGTQRHTVQEVQQQNEVVRQRNEELLTQLTDVMQAHALDRNALQDAKRDQERLQQVYSLAPRSCFFFFWLFARVVTHACAHRESPR